MHVISKDGLIYSRVDGERPQPAEFDSGKYPTAEMVFRAKSSRGDYHDNMDTDVFMMWIDRRLLPAFRAKYGPDMTLVLVIDNAPYHHGRCEDGFFCAEHNKAEIAEKLAELGCTELSVKMTVDPKKQLAQPAEPPTPASPPEQYIGWYLIDVEDKECFEVTHLALDDSEYDQDMVLCVTKMAVQRGAKSLLLSCWQVQSRRCGKHFVAAVFGTSQLCGPPSKMVHAWSWSTGNSMASIVWYSERSKQSSNRRPAASHRRCIPEATSATLRSD